MPQSDGAGAERGRPFTEAYHRGGRSKLEAATDGLYRSLPDARARPGDADRRNPAGAGRPGPGWQSTLHRLLELPGLGDLQGAVDERPAQPAPLRVCTTAL